MSTAPCEVCGQDVRLVEAINPDSGTRYLTFTLHAEPGKKIEQRRGELQGVCPGSYARD